MCPPGCQWFGSRRFGTCPGEGGRHSGDGLPAAVRRFGNVTAQAANSDGARVSRVRIAVYSH